MDKQALAGLGPTADPHSQARALKYFEELKNSDAGWQICIGALTSGIYERDDHVLFFCFQVLEHFIKTRYHEVDTHHQQFLRKFLSEWIQIQSCRANTDKAFLKNKAAQVFSLVFINDYPHRWPSFLSDLLQTLKYGPAAVDFYLRILLAIDSEVVDRENVQLLHELERNSRIKDTMREQCVTELVDSWYQIITNYENVNPPITCQCLDIIGVFISWIDINLVANDQFAPVFVRFLSNDMLRESACECILEVINKGMDPVSKTKLVELFVTLLENAGVLVANENDESDFTVKLAKLLNGIGVVLVMSWNKLTKVGDHANAAVTLQSIESKLPLLLKFLNSVYDDVSQAIIEFTRDYIQLLKQLPVMNQSQLSNIEALLFVVMNKHKYDDSYNFEHEGEDEGLFIRYRKQLKVVFDNLAQLDSQIVLKRVQEYVMKTLQQWQVAPFQDVEAAIYFLYILGEAIPVTHGNHFSGSDAKVTAMNEMMSLLATSGVSCHSHVSVILEYFETIVRYEKFFNQLPQHIPDVLTVFMDHRGLRHSNPKVCSRVAYLFSRFVKCLKAHMQNYTEDILRRLQDHLTLAPYENGMATSMLTLEDQLYLFETAAVLVVCSQFEQQRKQRLMKELLSPVILKYDHLLKQFAVETDKDRQELLAKCLAHAIAVTSRTSKAFSNQQTMKSCGCVQIYLEALQVFLPVLQVSYQQDILQVAVRQFLHRMVVCLEEELLPYIPSAAEFLLKKTDIRSVQEFIPLINQIITKFKLSWVFQKEIVPFLQTVFMPIVNVIFEALAVPIDERDQQAAQEKKSLQRNYFTFIAAIVTNGITDVIASQDTNDVHRVLLTVIHGAVNIPDPVAQKTCFSVLKKLVDLWGGKDGLPGFEEFMYKNIVPACFMAPLKDTFDLGDAQSIQALSESALCLKMVLDKRGEELICYLQTEYLPTLDVSPQLVQEYCQALNSDTKVFKTYVKLFFQRAKS